MKSTVLACAAAALTCSPALAGSCDAVSAAMIEGVTVPTRILYTAQVASVGVSFENYALNRKIYTKKNGAWAVEKRKDDDDKIRANWSDKICTVEAGGTIDGEAVDVISNHDSAGGITMDARYWISRDTGLILKNETDMPNNSALTAVYQYRDVTIPPDALAADR